MRAVIFLALALSAAAPLAAQSFVQSQSPAYATTFAPDSSADVVSLAQRKQHGRLVALRAEALELREADGGTLSAEHVALIQGRLDSINARFVANTKSGCFNCAGPMSGR